MANQKEPKRKDDDRAREPGRHPQAPEPPRRVPGSNRPDTLRPGPDERERKERARHSDESGTVGVRDEE
jgi:hypothetical protein